MDTDTIAALSRRQFIVRSSTAGVPLLGLAAGSTLMFATDANGNAQSEGLALESEDPIPIRRQLGIVIVGASSGMGAEMARQYARHGAAIVLAARRADRLAAVAAEVTAAGGMALVRLTDVRQETDCIAMVNEAIAWLAFNGRPLDLLVLGSYRAQVSPFTSQMSSAVWRNVIDTSYFGPAFCLREALPQLKQDLGTVFYFNSITSSFALPQAIAYTSVKHAWRAILNSVKFENPELGVVTSHFNAVDTEGFDKELTMFANDNRYCPSFFKSYVAPATEMCPVSFAVSKAIQAIEQKRPNVFLSLLNRAAWVLGATDQQLCGFLTMLELVMRHQSVQRAETDFRAALRRAGAAGYVARLLRRLYASGRTELITAASLLLSLDRGAALFLLALDDRLDAGTIATTRQRTAAFFENAGNGNSAQLMLAVSSGALPGTTADQDGLAPVGACVGV